MSRGRADVVVARGLATEPFLEPEHPDRLGIEGIGVGDRRPTGEPARRPGRASGDDRPADADEPVRAAEGAHGYSPVTFANPPGSQTSKYA